VSTKYVLRSHAFSAPQTINGGDGDPKEVFERTVARMGIASEQVSSYWRVGEAFSQDSQINSGQSVTMWDRAPGEEMIFAVRNLPVLENDARAILAGHFMSSKATLVLNNQEECLTKRSRAAFDELIEAGLLSEEPADNGYDEARRYALTEEGKAYPRMVPFDFMSRHGTFKLVEEIASREQDAITEMEP
jgi:hypothetical protein